MKIASSSKNPKLNESVFLPRPDLYRIEEDAENDVRELRKKSKLGSELRWKVKMG